MYSTSPAARANVMPELTGTFMSPMELTTTVCVPVASPLP